ncbi:transcriptional regulator with XRE-family HTH domain [Streptomyces sp. V4I23]|uniref:helix-turn-helix domain-containing protein n=1 Tax=Streptomyces sp. V4I23 TaxID=3042282 RepID=UPI00278AC89B|nr:helix-turn-helix transcriptional regulator [Streptomyces sp. V4I23]MDQ1013204.1 transcriptional regulator with XRE-family HTH domain [Streptomyces sp. V4I23]
MTRSRHCGAPERPFAHLAEHLLALRRAAGLPQRALVAAANVSRGTVQRAESGTAAPSPDVLDAYVRACGGSPADQTRALLLRSRGRTAQRGRLRTLDAPAPALIHTEDDLGAALAAAYERAGAPSLRELSRLAPGRAPLPPTTAWRIVKRRKLPPTTAQLGTFLTACGIRPADQSLYIDAYHRITADRGTRPAPPRARRTLRLLFRRVHPVPLSHGGTDDRYELTGAAAAIARQLPASTLEDLLFTTLTHMATREAHRNGIALPDLWLTDQATDIPGDLITTRHIPSGSSHRKGPDHPAPAPLIFVNACQA